MKFWADIDNAPHVLVLEPIIRWLNAQGQGVQITARDHGQTLPLLQLLGLPYVVTGKHAGKQMYRKVLSLVTRSVQLIGHAAGKGYSASFCHGTRALYPAAKLLGIPLVVLQDYEHGALPRFMCRWPDRVLVPHVIPDEAFIQRGVRPESLRKYPGLKEELYVYDVKPDAAPLLALGLDLQRPIVLIRPPASMAHYHVQQSDELFVGVMQWLRARGDLQVVVLPRADEQRRSIEGFLQENPSPNVRIPEVVSYGPDLIYYSDLVISGGGTMNREAACMGVPVYTIFKGPMGSVDRHLIGQGRLKVLDRPGELDAVTIQKRPRPDLAALRPRRERIVRFIGEVILSVARTDR